MGRCPKPCQRDLSLWTPAFDWIENEAAPVFVIGSGFSYGAPHNKSFEQTFSPRRARLRIAKAASYAMHHRKPNTLNECQNKSFDQTFSPRRARLRIAKAASYAIHHRKPNTLNECQNKSFDQTFSKVCRFLGQRPKPCSAEHGTPLRRSSAGVNPIKRSGGSFFGEGRPAIEGAPK